MISLVVRYEARPFCVFEHFYYLTFVFTSTMSRTQSMVSIVRRKNQGARLAKVAVKCEQVVRAAL